MQERPHADAAQEGPMESEDAQERGIGFANSGGVVFVDESAEEIGTAKAGWRGQRCWIAAAGPAVGW